MQTENQEAIPAFMDYILYEYERTLDNTPSIIAINDANQLLQNQIFSEKLPTWFDELNKKNALAIFVCDVSNKIDKNISVVNNKFVTNLFLPDKEAISYKEAFELSKETVNTIIDLKLIYRHFLIKQNNELVIVELNLDGMDYAIKALSGKQDAINAMDKAIAKYGENPNRWIVPFYKNLFPSNHN